MSSNDPRDRAIEAALRKGAVQRSASGECLDAETMAAMADGGLGQRARARAEAHMASCARCQTVMAALVGSGADLAKPASSVTADRPWWHLNLRWLAPLTGVAAAVLLWMVVPDAPRNAPRVDERAASQPVEAPSEPANAPSAAAPSPDTAADQEAIERKLTRAEPVAPPAERQADPTGREITPPARRNQAEGERSADLLAKAEERSTPVGGVSPAPPPARQEPGAPEADRPAAPAVAAPPPPPAQAFGTLAEPARSRAEAAARDSALRDSTALWRSAGPGVLERSGDGGSTWERLDTGTQADLRAGSCPSPSVCWAVGRAGVVLLTTDARSWRQVSTPLPEDLVAVDATDAKTAAVRSAGGQSFRTVDAGVTWTRVP